MKHLKISYHDVMSMPTWERRFYMDKFREDSSREQEHMERMREKQKNGGKSISGESVKNYSGLK